MGGDDIRASPQNRSTSRSTVLPADSGVERPFNTRSIPATSRLGLGRQPGTALGPDFEGKLVGARRLASIAVIALGGFIAGPASADTANFELNGKIYTKFLYKNDNTQGCLSLSNPFWPDNIGGSNGACTEFELNILGRVSKSVTTGVRLKSRFGALWQGWWENGDTRWDYPTDTLFTENTSGESMGMNHAQYMKLRGAWIRVAPPIPTVRYVHFGASDLGMFNEWTVGKMRYIDRDNANAVIVDGGLVDSLKYTVAAIAVPKLFVGPRWTSGLKDGDPLSSFWGGDWAYAMKFEADAGNDLSVRLIGNYVQDWEADVKDPDLTGPSDTERGTNRAVEREDRYQAYNATFDAQYSPSFFDVVSVSGLFAYAWNKANLDYATNSARNDQGFSPLLYLFDDDGNLEAAAGAAGKVLVELFDPLKIGLSAKFEYFNIGEEYNAIFGSRREADVLITDGIITSGFTSGGQLPTLNLANEFVDFDEPWYETIIGWHGGTALLEYQQGVLNLGSEFTYITYNTNEQGRDVDTQYPDFLYTDGFTDTASFTADRDYANVYDRGKDPRSVFKRNQDRQTRIVVLDGDALVPGITDLKFAGKFKWVHDEDTRKADSADDDYEGDLWLGFGQFDYQWTNELKTGLGYEFQTWHESNRSGTQEAGFHDYDTKKHAGRLTAGYTFGGLTFNYLLEYFRKEQERARPGTPDQRWRVWRAKATVEAGW